MIWPRHRLQVAGQHVRVQPEALVIRLYYVYYSYKAYK